MSFHLPPSVIVFLALLGAFLGWVSTQGTKSQWVRLLDVFVYGPILIYAGYLLWKENVWFAGALILMGASTITYNLRNYIEISKNN